jgi:hypothetical protein
MIIFDFSIHLKEAANSSALREKMHKVAARLEFKNKYQSTLNIKLTTPHGVNEIIKKGYKSKIDHAAQRE